MDTEALVKALKLEANALYVNNDCAAALQKYTEAIEICNKDDKATLAILYSNRAAASLNLREPGYLDAIRDGQAATSSDPTYAKGFLRIAAAANALEMWPLVIEAFESVLALTTDQNEKDKYRASIRAAKTAMKNYETTFRRYISERPLSGMRELPWMRATAFVNSGSLDPESSGQVILHAYMEFQPGLDRLKNIRIIPQPGGTHVLVITAGKVIEPFVNGLLCDGRVFHADIPMARFGELLTRQVNTEIHDWNGWQHSVEPRQIKKDVVARLNGGASWAQVRPAMGTTFRGWILQAFMDSSVGRRLRAEQDYRRAIEMIEWGRRKYAHVPRQDRGSIFEPTILRAVRKLRLKNLLGIHQAAGFSLDDIAEMAVELKNETMASEHPPGFNGQGFFGFWKYPIAEAIAVLGWVHMRRGLEHLRISEECDDEGKENAAFEEAKDEFRQSRELYIEAAQAFPFDDENHPYMLAIALEAAWHGAAPLRTTLPLARRVCKAIPPAARIWEAKFSTDMKAKFKEVADFITQCETEIRKGNWKLDEWIAPPQYGIHPGEGPLEQQSAENLSDDSDTGDESESNDDDAGGVEPAMRRFTLNDLE
ncbi:hypothetical protein HMN09_00901100 [Mycena chlorophos]|uniref:TPR-like protein n=1 Tax=Mycena chlorophos TaxID=658473 RepID=A0A8H6SRK6_MYCCL|nr:hypothetical protein HMN09_00901100 [Mycena chlorophos]